ncbi:MAG TPA: hypothetical protein VL049_11880 [Candidatus Dormibacteraeota bacterium]|nr:hypothetical protein [Candidatus Dormibacteraeota bacterium]
MRLRINPLRFLVLLVVYLLCTYYAWKPVAPAYAQVLLRATQVGMWLSEFSSDPTWSHATSLFIDRERSPTAIFYVQRNLFLTAPPPPGVPMLDYLRANPGVVRIPPPGIPAEWVMANLVLLIPLMLATPAPTWRARFGRLALALAIALALQVFDVIVSIKSFYASTFPGTWSWFAGRVYQFFDAFVQSWDTQLFPFVIWAGIHLRQLLPAAMVPEAAPASVAGSRAERRRQARH